jgi:hypothetical protein
MNPMLADCGSQSRSQTRLIDKHRCRSSRLSERLRAMGQSTERD